MSRDTVTFWSDGVRCAADLLIPDAADGAGPGLVIGHGFNQTRAALGAESEYFCAAGYVVLAIDYRSYGESEGEPRQHIDPRRQSDDVRNALTYLSQRDEVDPERLGIWGVSFAGGVFLHAAAFDHRVKAVVAQSPIVNGRRWIREVRSYSNYRKLRAAVEANFVDRYGPTPGPDARLPVGGPGPALTAVYMDELPDAGDSDPDNPNAVSHPMLHQPHFDPMITVQSVERVLDWNPEDIIDMIAPRPLLIIANDERDSIHQLDHVQRAFTRAGEPKQLVVLRRDMNDLYEEPGRAEAMALAIAFFHEHLQLEPGGARDAHPEPRAVGVGR